MVAGGPWRAAGGLDSSPWHGVLARFRPRASSWSWTPMRARSQALPFCP